MRKLLSDDEYKERWLQFQNRNERRNFLESFKIFYSSVVDGFSESPATFSIPIDDHGFHRGDGVFEAMKVVGENIYLMKPHLDRLERSLKAIGLTAPVSRQEIESILTEAVRLARLKTTPEMNLLLRLYVTRGGGGFGVSVKESSRSELYTVVTSFAPPTEDVWSKGVSLCFSKISVKPAPFCQIKSLNYLPNVMMKTEALSQGHDFSIGFDLHGFITESATENVAIINQQDELCHPQWVSILDGCTLKRTFQLVKEQNLLQVREAVDMTKEDLVNAKEILMIGTTLDVTPVTKLDGVTRARGPWAQKLRALLLADQR